MGTQGRGGVGGEGSAPSRWTATGVWERRSWETCETVDTKSCMLVYQITSAPCK